MTLPCLSIRQPWAWRILNEGKDVENRDWPTRFRGTFLIHASKGVDTEDRDEVRAKAMPLGGIVGRADIVDCVTASDSKWFFGRYGFVLENVRPLPFIPCRGALGFLALRHLRLESYQNRSRAKSDSKVERSTP